MRILLSLSKEPLFQVDLDYALGVTKAELNASVAQYNSETKSKVKVVGHSVPKRGGAPSGYVTIEGTKRDVVFVAAAWLDTDPDQSQLEEDWDLEFRIST